MMKKQLVLSSVLAVALGSPALMAKDKSAELASIDGHPLTADMYKDALEKLGPQAEMVKGNPQVRGQFLDHLINSELLAKAAKGDKLDESKDFKAQLDDARRDILARLYMEKYIAQETSDKKLKEYFNNHQDRFSGEEIRAAHILFKDTDKKTAEEVLKQAKAKGADFEALAKKYSIGPAGPKGGDLGFFGHGRMVPEFEKAAFSLKKGEVYPDLVKSQFGYHIIKVTDVKKGQKSKFEDKKEEVAQIVRREAQQDLVDNLRKKSKVKVNESALRDMKF